MKFFVKGYVLVTCGWIAVVLLKTFIDPGSGSWPDWLAAIGTIAAFLGTIYLATDNARNARKERLIVARLCAISVDRALSHRIAIYGSVIFVMSKMREKAHKLNVNEWREMVDYAKTQISDAPAIDIELLKDLTILSPNSVLDVADDIGKQKMLLSMMTNMHFLTDTDRVSGCKDVEDSAEAAQKNLQKALEELRHDCSQMFPKSESNYQHSDIHS